MSFKEKKSWWNIRKMSFASFLTLFSVIAIVTSQSTIGTIDLSNVVSRSKTCRTVFQTSFESFSDFILQNFYITPLDNPARASRHNITSERARTGNKCHKGQFYAYSYEPHMGFPAVEFYKQPEGPIANKIYAEVWVYLDSLTFPSDPWEWLMLATFATDSEYSRFISVNIDKNNLAHLMHVPRQGEKYWTYQDLNAVLPFDQWVNITTYVDFSKDNGMAVLWMNGKVVSIAQVQDTNGVIADSHFGLYCSGNVTTGAIFNDDLIIQEVAESYTSCPMVEAKTTNSTPSNPTTIEPTRTLYSGANVIVIKISSSLLILLILSISFLL